MIRGFLSDTKGSPAAEFVLALPIMLALMFGGLEAGHFFWTEHKLVKAVRDGARYASRLPVDDLCNGEAVEFAAGVEDNIREITRTGMLDGTVPKVPGWEAGDVEVDVSCEAFVDTGIYSDLGAQGPLVTVSSGSVPYPSIFAGLGFISNAVQLRAQSSAAVMGI